MDRIDKLFNEAGYDTSKAWQHGYNQGILDATPKVLAKCSERLHKGLKRLKVDESNPLHAWIDNELAKVREELDNDKK